jgi:hypothetical protein
MNEPVVAGDWVMILEDNFDPMDYRKMKNRIGVVTTYGDLNYFKCYHLGSATHIFQENLGYFSYRKINELLYKLVGDCF